jgi:hypothetical protein
MLEEIKGESLETIIENGDEIILVGHNPQHSTYGIYQTIKINESKLVLQLKESLNIPTSIHIPSQAPKTLREYIKSNQNIGNEKYKLNREIDLSELPQKTQIYKFQKIK